MSAATQPEGGSGAVLDALCGRHEFPLYFTAPEVTLSGRRIDLLVFGIWPSTGRKLIGYEIKVDRADWLREVKSPEKSHEWFNTVDEFYLVSTPGVVQKGEAPGGWGHLEYVKGRLMNRQQCVRREGAGAVPREIVARLFHALHDSRNAETRREKDAIRAEVIAGVQREFEYKYQRTTKEYDDLRKESQELHDLMRDLGAWGWKSREDTLGLAARLKRLDEFESAISNRAWPVGIANAAKRLTECVDDLMKAVKPASPPPGGAEP